MTLSAEESQRVGEAVMAELEKYKLQPVLYLMDLVDVEIPASQQGLRDTYQRLMRDCRGLRCPSCGEDTQCMPRPYD